MAVTQALLSFPFLIFPVVPTRTATRASPTATTVAAGSVKR